MAAAIGRLDAACSIELEVNAVVLIELEVNAVVLVQVLLI